MTQAKDSVKMNGVFKVILVIGILLSALFSGVAMYNSNQEVAIPEGLSGEDVRAIVADELDNQSVSVDVPEVDTERIDDVYEKVYSDEITELEGEALAAYEDEFNESDFEEAVEDLIEDFDKLNNVSEEDSEVEVKDLGLDDKENRLVEVIKEYDIKYEDNQDDSNIKETIIVEGMVTYDEDDGSYEADLSYSLE